MVSPAARKSSALSVTLYDQPPVSFFFPTRRSSDLPGLATDWLPLLQIADTRVGAGMLCRSVVSGSQRTMPQSGDFTVLYPDWSVCSLRLSVSVELASIVGWSLVPVMVTMIWWVVEW